jgi:hypothetical protein
MIPILITLNMLFGKIVLIIDIYKMQLIYPLLNY